MKNEINETAVENQIQKTLTDLKLQHKTWNAQLQTAETSLYNLLDGCLDFYYFLRKSESYESAFKSLCYFKWNSTTKLSTLIAKSVFGEENKQHYAYAKAIQKAIENDIGIAGEVSMQQWLKQNGGVNGVIRTNETAIKENILREHLIEVAKKAHDLGFIPKIAKFKNKQLAEIMSSRECLLLCVVDEKTGDIALKYISTDENLVKLTYEEFGKFIVRSPKYEEGKQKLHDKLELERQKASVEVSSKLGRIGRKNTSTASVITQELESLPA
ncbi:hypothetical protein SAMN05216296_2460 [Pseudomonas pohangensis]|uniref:Uncharacterized protein n=1 Tax=Pseudomonas pohangensis TaxID=364197 RepID=A0A1H2GQB1_9PSED|nr:hypothetical protein [Pseudomonas pohangensis]SDU21734.1 hypothetical protein SAMN05216296_2460 [Pseudomonas pohangensis]